jgi:hypothetical protein
MARSIQELTDQQLLNFIKSYGRAGKTEGGKFSLAQLHVERLRRSPSERSPHEVLKFVVEEARKDPSGTTTYGRVWEFLRPGAPWQGNHSGKLVGSTLGAVIAYCIRNDLPLASTLVVRSGSRKLSPEAIDAIYQDAKLYGLAVGPIPSDFVRQETERARQMNVADLPEV